MSTLSEPTDRSAGSAAQPTGKLQAEPASPGRRGYVLGVITAIYALNFMDRSILGVLLDPIKKEFQLTDTMMGLMIGPGFGLTYALLGVPISRWADRINRVKLIAAGLTFWSLMTAVGGIAQNAWQMFAARLGVGVGESTGASPGQSLISDYYPKDRRPLAFSIYHFAPAIGLYLALLIGGTISHYFTWRMAFFFAGIPGLIVALLFLFTVREPVRGLSDGTSVDRKHYKITTTMKYLVTNKTYLLCVAGMLLAAYVNFTMSSWMPSYLRRVHHMTGAQIGLYAAPVKAIMGLVGALTGGLLISALSKGRDRLKLLIPAATATVYGPAMMTFFLTDQTPVMYIALGVGAFLGAFGQGSVVAVIQTVLKVRMRAYGSGLALLMANILIFSGAPLLIGILNELLKGHFGVQAVRYSMLTTVVSTILAGICYFVGTRFVKQDIKRALEEDLDVRRT